MPEAPSPLWCRLYPGMCPTAMCLTHWAAPTSQAEREAWRCWCNNDAECNLNSALLEWDSASHISVGCIHFSIWFWHYRFWGKENTQIDIFFSSKLIVNLIKVSSSLKNSVALVPFFFFSAWKNYIFWAINLESVCSRKSHWPQAHIFQVTSLLENFKS